MQDHLFQTQVSAIWVSASSNKLSFEKEQGKGCQRDAASAHSSLIFEKGIHCCSSEHVGDHPWAHGGEVTYISKILSLVNYILKGHKDDVPQSNKNIHLVTLKAPFSFQSKWEGLKKTVERESKK